MLLGKIEAVELQEIAIREVSLVDGKQVGGDVGVLGSCLWNKERLSLLGSRPRDSERFALVVGDIAHGALRHGLSLRLEVAGTLLWQRWELRDVAGEVGDRIVPGATFTLARVCWGGSRGYLLIIASEIDDCLVVWRRRLAGSHKPMVELGRVGSSFCRPGIHGV